MIYRIYPFKDTFITNDYVAPNLTRLSGANLGASEELDVFKRAGISGAIGSAGSSSLGRALLQFDFTRFGELTASGEIPSAGVTFRLRMNHKTRGCPEPKSYAMSIKPISSSWDEGTGMDILYGDEGFSNWDKRSSTEFWTTAGGDFISSTTASAYFDTGVEDIDVDVTAIVNSWLSGTFPNYGVGVMMTASIESDAVYTDYYRKKFYSRHTSYHDRAPYIEARVADFSADSRANMQWGRTGSLYLYNVIGGVFSDLAGEVVASIADASGVLTYVTASRGTTAGIYSASFALPTGSYSGSLFYDRWRAGSKALLTGTFTLSSPSPTNTLTQYPLTARIRNMQDEYLPEDVPVFEVLFRKRPHTLPVFTTASLGPTPYVVERAWYAIENDSTRERVVPFGTGSQNHTKLSYGGSGNSFKFHMTNLHAGNVYRIVFLVDEQGRKQIIDPGFKFRVV